MRWKSDLWPVRPSFIMKANIIKGNSLNLKTGNVEEHRWIHQHWGHRLKYLSLTSWYLEKCSGHSGTMIKNTIQCNAVFCGPWWVCLPKLIDIMWEVNCFIDIIPILKRAKGKNYLSVFPKRIILTMPCNFIRFILNIWLAKNFVFQLPRGSNIHNKCSTLCSLFTRRNNRHRPWKGRSWKGVSLLQVTRW